MHKDFTARKGCLSDAVTAAGSFPMRVADILFIITK